MNAMALKLEDDSLDKKLREADCALNRIMCYIEGVGKEAKPRISLLINKAGEDGQGNTGGV